MGSFISGLGGINILGNLGCRQKSVREGISGISPFVKRDFLRKAVGISIRELDGGSGFLMGKLTQISNLNGLLSLIPSIVQLENLAIERLLR
jgi:hypothetical protein